MGSKRDKHRFVRVKHDGASFVDTPAGAAAFLADSTEAYQTEDVWMTDGEFENLPEFAGF